MTYRTPGPFRPTRTRVGARRDALSSLSNVPSVEPRTRRIGGGNQKQILRSAQNDDHRLTHHASRITPAFLIGLAVTLLVSPCRADRLVLAPRALITIPNSAKVEFAARASGRGNNLGWASVGLPGSLNGFEVEAERVERVGSSHWTGSIQYSFTGNAFTDVAPAFSVGLRDLANEGYEGRSVFAAASKSIPLSLAQNRLLKQLWLDAGYGTSHLGGPYIGFQGKLAFGPVISAEYLARRLNASIAVPLSRHLDLKAYSLNGQTYYGAAFFLVK